MGDAGLGGLDQNLGAVPPYSEAANAIFGGTWAGNVMAIAVIISGFGGLNGCG
jgi:hypothetical protein